VCAACEREDVGSGTITLGGDWRCPASWLVGKPIDPGFAEVQTSDSLALPAPTVAARSGGIGITCTRS